MNSFQSQFFLVLSAAASVSLNAQTLTTLYSFDGAHGDSPQFGLTKGADGNYYGTTFQGGTNNLGTVFKITPSGAQTTLFSFPSYTGNFDGTQPQSPLLLASDGNFYGIARGYASDCSLAYKVTPAGQTSVLYDFCQPFVPNGPRTLLAGLIQANDGNLYGTAEYGAANGSGGVYRLTLSGVMSVIHSFTIDNNGYYPTSQLVQGTDGYFYGTTAAGTIFRVKPDGSGFSSPYSFALNGGGEFLDSGLIQASDSNFYGASEGGGDNFNGTIYKLTAAGTFSVLHTFSKTGAEGSHPSGVQLLQGSDGNLYGTTTSGGASGNGTVFKISTAGVYTTLYSFGVNDGGTPYGSVVQGADGALYGTTSAGGANFRGTVFKLTIPGAGTTGGGAAAPAITSVVSGAGFQAGGPITPGAWVSIFGGNLAPANDSRTWNTSTEIVNGKLPTSLDGTSVSINGKAAAVAYISPTQVNVQAPDDVATGPVQVVVTTAAGGASPSSTVNYAQFSPGLFPATAPYLAVQHADGSYVGGYSGSTPAKPGEVIVLWGSGFGPASPAVASGQVVTSASKLTNSVTVKIGGQPATVDYAGVVGAGLVQINAHVPASINNGDAAVVATVGGVSTQGTANMIAIHN